MRLRKENRVFDIRSRNPKDTLMSPERCSSFRVLVSNPDFGIRDAFSVIFIFLISIILSINNHKCNISLHQADLPH